MSEPLFVCHICAPGDVGGLERVVQALALGHHGRGIRSEVLSVIGPEEGPHPFATSLRAGGVPVHEVRLPSKAVIRERRAVRSLLEELRPGVLHCHGYRPDILHGPTARGLGIPTVSTEHGSEKAGGMIGFFEWLQVRLLPRQAGVIAVSTPIAEWLLDEGVPRRLVHMIPNGWTGGTEFLPREEAREALGLPPDRTVVGFIGRLSRAKGADVFVEALLRLDDPSVTGVVIGDGTEREALEERVRAAGAGDRILFLGTVNPAAPLFRGLDLFVLSSRTEGTPIVLLEAVAAGVPVVASAVGGVPDVVGEDGALLVPPEEPETLANAIGRALADPDEGARRAERAEARVAHEFSGELWLDRHERLYRSVARGPGGAISGAAG